MKTIKKKISGASSPKEKTFKKQNVADLLAIMAKLRGPSGCPWDREQTENTLKKYLIEEAYEVLEAIEMNNPDELKEELGDLLLQIIFLSRIAEEKEQFNFLEVVHILGEKLIRRHPHVFSPTGKIPGKGQPKDAQSVVEIWKYVKENEEKRSEKLRESMFSPFPFRHLNAPRGCRQKFPVPALTGRMLMGFGKSSGRTG